MTSTPREIGTLIVVVLKANHLPNKRNIGKQDPYCTVTFNGEERKTRAIKRGGQHPEWDEEIRFTLFEDTPDRLPSASGAPPPLPPKDDKNPPKVKGGTFMKLQCYAQEREPDLIGECKVDLTEVLTKGETDEWFTLMNKDKFAGKVYLELTFYANAPPPVKKVTPKPVANKQYAGPGSFVPLGEPNLANGTHPGRSVSASGAYDHDRNASDSIPASLRASTKLDLYSPPYEQRNRLSGVDQLTNDFNEFGVTEHRPRAETLPPRTPITPRPVTPSYTHGDPYASYYSNQSSQVYTENQYLGPSHHQPAYSNGNAGRLSTIKAPRHSIPATSSGFMPLSSASTFTAAPQHHHAPEPSGYMYDSNPYTTPTPQPSHTPTAVVQHSHTPSSGSGTYIPQHSFSAPPAIPYNQYSAPQPVPTHVPHLQIPGQIPSGYPSPSYTPAPGLDNYGHPYQQQASSMFQSNAAGGRPLPAQPPPPQSMYNQQPVASYTPAPTVIHSYPTSSFGTQPVPSSNDYQPLPAPPPPPPAVIEYNHQLPPPPHRHSSLPTPPEVSPTKLPTPPPPPPLQSMNNVSPTSQRRASSLPQPPILYQEHLQQDPYSIPYPPPPPPPLPEQEYQQDYQHHAQLPPPPPPPVGLPTNPPMSSFPQGSWLNSGQIQYTQPGYA